MSARSSTTPATVTSNRSRIPKRCAVALKRSASSGLTLGLGKSGTEAAIGAEIEQCRQWLARPEPRGPAPACSTAPYAGVLFPDQGRTLGLARLIAFLFAGIRAWRQV